MKNEFLHELVRRYITDKNVSLEEFVNVLKTNINAFRKFSNFPDFNCLLKEKIKKNILPTQNEIDINNSLTWLFQNKPEIAFKIFAGKEITVNDIGSPVIVGQFTLKNETFNFIIDGHHRWLEAYLLSPDDNPKIPSIVLDCQNLHNPLQLLKLYHIAIAVSEDYVPSSHAESKYNIFTMTNKEVVIFLVNLLKNSPKFVHLLEMNEIDPRYFIESVIHKVQNVKKMKPRAEFNPFSHKIMRRHMPQTQDLKKIYEFFN